MTIAKSDVSICVDTLWESTYGGVSPGLLNTTKLDLSCRLLIVAGLVLASPEVPLSSATGALLSSLSMILNVALLYAKEVKLNPKHCQREEIVKCFSMK